MCNNLLIINSIGRVLYNPALRRTIRNNTEELDRDEHHGENSKEEEPPKFTRNVLLGKLSCAVITLIVQITALILLVAYLATVRCSIESGGQENVTCTTNPTKSSHNWFLFLVLFYFSLIFRKSRFSPLKLYITHHDYKILAQWKKKGEWHTTIKFILE